MARIAEITAQNPWWSQGEEFARFDPRLKRAEPIFFERKRITLEKGNIYILRGPRQVGKTTYLKDLVRKLLGEGVPARDILYLSLDFFTSRRELRNAVTYFLESRRDSGFLYLLLDEITSLRDWNLELKFMSDRGILQRGVVLATGSNAVKLKEKGELLPGRGLEGNEHYLKPLGFREFVRQSVAADFLVRGNHSGDLSLDEFKYALHRLESVLPSCCLNLASGIEDMRKEVDLLLPFKRELGYLFRIYLTTGGIPGVINHYFTNRYFLSKDKIEAEIAEIFIRDVLGDISRLQKQEIITRQILKAISGSYGSRYSFSKLSREIQRNHITTIDYLEFMEDSFISFILYAYDPNRKEIKEKGDKKVYFFDPFIFYSLKSYLEGKAVWDVIMSSLEDEDLSGALVEGMVISHLRMQGEKPFLRAGNTFLWYYYDKQGKEIDAIYREDEAYMAIEVKYQWQLDERAIKKIVPIKKYIGLSKEDVVYKEGLMIVPVDVFLALLPVSAGNL